jgi:asparagine synthase (glutamine-hydrolysing)
MALDFINMIFMCRIVGVFDLQESANSLRSQVLVMSKRIRHREPDWSGIYCENNAILAHERLVI